jgi:hypothetical protein
MLEWLGAMKSHLQDLSECKENLWTRKGTMRPGSVSTNYGKKTGGKVPFASRVF